MIDETLEKWDRLLIEVAELGNFVELSRVADEQSVWWLADEDEESLVIEWNEGIQRLMLSTEIGVVPERNMVDALKQALYYNLVWQQTGGARMALLPEDDSLRLMIDLPGEHLESIRVATVANNLLQAARDWRSGWDKAPDPNDTSSTADDSPGDEPMPPSDFIRV
ncbi:MAG: type III secretion system chaperone [Candidatus Competibacteraceae bacterium]|jgi:hypothetical protein|nr:type III secretion system chaperone [Candidatus Competibacteraceae bacterium]